MWIFLAGLFGQFALGVFPLLYYYNNGPLQAYSDGLFHNANSVWVCSIDDMARDSAHTLPEFVLLFVAQILAFAVSLLAAENAIPVSALIDSE